MASRCSARNAFSWLSCSVWVPDCNSRICSSKPLVYWARFSLNSSISWPCVACRFSFSASKSFTLCTSSWIAFLYCDSRFAFVSASFWSYFADSFPSSNTNCFSSSAVCSCCFCKLCSNCATSLVCSSSKLDRLSSSSAISFSFFFNSSLNSLISLALEEFSSSCFFLNSSKLASFCAKVLSNSSFIFSICCSKSLFNVICLSKVSFRTLTSLS